MYCLFVCFWFFVTLENFSLIWWRHHCRWRVANFDLCSAHKALSSEGSLACYTYCDTGHPFIMVISEDPWHRHLLYERLAVDGRRGAYTNHWFPQVTGMIFLKQGWSQNFFSMHVVKNGKIFEPHFTIHIIMHVFHKREVKFFELIFCGVQYKYLTYKSPVLEVW